MAIILQTVTKHLEVRYLSVVERSRELIVSVVIVSWDYKKLYKCGNMTDQSVDF